MSKPQIHGNRRALSASSILETAGDALSRIRQEDRLTWNDIGAVLGKSEDQAAKYADASAEMGLVAFIRAKREWNGRFTGGLDRLTDAARDGQDAQHAQSCILKAALALSVALEDGELDLNEVMANRSTLENARDAINNQLARLRPGVAA